MTANELADWLDAYTYCEPTEQAAAMLRAQHEAIKTLRDGLHQVSLASQCSMSSQRECGTIARKALAATEEF